MKVIQMKAVLSEALREQAKHSAGTWTAKDSAAVTMKVLTEMKGIDGAPLEIPPEILADLERAFDPPTAQLHLLKSSLEGLMEPNPALEAQLSVLLDPDALRKKLQDAKALAKPTRKRVQPFKALLALSE